MVEAGAEVEAVAEVDMMTTAETTEDRTITKIAKTKEKTTTKAISENKEKEEDILVEPTTETTREMRDRTTVREESTADPKIKIWAMIDHQEKTTTSSSISREVQDRNTDKKETTDFEAW